MTLQRLTRISLLAALCVALTSGFCPFPKMSNRFLSIFFYSLVIFEGYSFAFLVMMITMFVSAFFLGMSLIVFFQIVAFGCLMLILAHQLQVVALCPSDPFCGPTVLCLWGLDR